MPFQYVHLPVLVPGILQLLTFVCSISMQVSSVISMYVCITQQSEDLTNAELTGLLLKSQTHQRTRRFYCPVFLQQVCSVSIDSYMCRNLDLL